MLYKRGARWAYGRHLGRFGPIKAANALLRAHLVPAAGPILVQTSAQQMYVDALDSLSISTFGIYEPETTLLIERTLNPGDVFLDIGANIGWYTLLAASLVGETGKVFAFEPEPANFALLQKNIALAGYHNVDPMQKAVSDRNQTVTLYLRENNRGSHALYAGVDSASIPVEAVRLDDHLGTYMGKIDLIKMDIEGSEGHALMGMTALLKRNRGVKIIMELSPHALEQSGTPARDVLDMLRGLGFAFYTIDGQGSTPVSAEMLLQTYGGQPPKHTNILCIREDAST